MKKKIVGFLVMTLLIATTVLPLVGTMNADKIRVAGNKVDQDGIIENKGLVPELSVNSGGQADDDWVIDDASNLIYTGVAPAPITGNVGIGTTFPIAKLHVDKGNMVVSKEGYSGSSSFALLAHHSNDLYVGFASPDSAMFVYDYSTDNNDVVFAVKGDVGIGFDLSPDAKLEINSKGTTSDFLMLSSDADADGDVFIVKNDGNVGIGTTNPDAKLTIKAAAENERLLNGYNELGQVIVEIGEGLDYAEIFPISQDEVSSGMVVVIDVLNMGSLTISTEAYDSKVAGIVSGAKGLCSGMRLGAEVANGYAVALAGRVYCNVDAQYGDIEPGDLLTTSPTPGHAMVVKDFSTAQGATLGKAMEGLSGGSKGQILVLVTLQ